MTAAELAPELSDSWAIRDSSKATCNQYMQFVFQNLAIPEIHASRVLSGDRLSPPARTSLPSEHWRWQHCTTKQALKVQKIAKHWTLRPPGTLLELLALLRLVNPKTIWNSAFSYKRLQDPASSQSTGPRRLLPVKPLLGGGGLPVIPQTSIWHVLVTPSHSSSPTLEPKLRCRWVNSYHNVPDMIPYRFLASGSYWFLVHFLESLQAPLLFLTCSLGPSEIH